MTKLISIYMDRDGGGWALRVMNPKDKVRLTFHAYKEVSDHWWAAYQDHLAAVSRWDREIEKLLVTKEDRHRAYGAPGPIERWEDIK